MLRVLTFCASLALGGGTASAETLRQDFSEQELDVVRAQQYALIALPMMRVAAAEQKGPSRPLLDFGDLRELELPDGFEYRTRLMLDDHLNDPAAAEFRSLRLFAESDHVRFAVCGEVNRRNRYGVYTGFEPFMVIALNPDASKDAGEMVVHSRPWIYDTCKQMRDLPSDRQG